MERSKLLDLYSDRNDPSLRVDLRSSGMAEKSDSPTQPNLYRGWTKSEGALKKKKKEVSELKKRVQVIAESHAEFRAQMKTLESVKELALHLQSQNSALKKENTMLQRENNEFKDLNKQAEDFIRERLIDEEKHSKMVQELQQGLFTLRRKYEELDAKKRELEVIASDEKALRRASELKLESVAIELDECKNQFRVLQSNYDTCNARLLQCTSQLIQASEHLTMVNKEVDAVVETKEQLATTNAEVHILKGNLARMVRLIEQYPEAKSFCDHWGDSHGLSFVGPPQKLKKRGLELMGSSSSSSSSSASPSASASAFSAADKGISKGEFDQMKSMYDYDPYPLSASLEEEEAIWVPAEAHKAGMEFLSTKLPHTPTEVIMDFLRRMNKVWMRREKRKIIRIKQEYDDVLAEYKRRLSHSKPYQGVVAAKQIERLQGIVKDKRKKYNSGRPKKSSDTFTEDNESGSNFEDIDHLDLKSLPPHHKRLCQLEAMKAAQHKTSSSPSRKANISTVSTEKLLESSLISLEKLGQHNANQAIIRGHEMSLIRQSRSSQDGEQKNPSEAFLRGAVWLGRNCSALMDELADSLDNLKSSHLSDVLDAVRDPDMNRAVSRLHILTTSLLTEIYTTAIRFKLRCKDVVKDASRLIPGRKDLLDEFMSTLPLESASSHL